MNFNSLSEAQNIAIQRLNKMLPRYNGTNRPHKTWRLNKKFKFLGHTYQLDIFVRVTHNSRGPRTFRVSFLKNAMRLSRSRSYFISIPEIVKEFKWEKELKTFHVVDGLKLHDGPTFHIMRIATENAAWPTYNTKRTSK